MGIHAVCVTTKIILKSYIFKFNNKIIAQEEDSAIGCNITGDVVNLFIAWWDKKLKEKLTENSLILTLYSCYVDINILAKAPRQDSVDELEADTMGVSS